MSIRFIPLGIPFSSSYAMTASLALNTPSAGFPVSASIASFSLLPVGPSGSDGAETDGTVTT